MVVLPSENLTLALPTVLRRGGLVDTEKVLMLLRHAGSSVHSLLESSVRSELISSEHAASISESLSLPMGGFLAPTGVFIPAVGLGWDRRYTDPPRELEKTSVAQYTGGSFPKWHG